MERVKVVFVGDGLGYRDRFLFAYLFYRSVRERVILEGGMSSLAEELRVSVRELSEGLKSLEEKGYIKRVMVNTGGRSFLREIKLMSRGYDRLKVPKDFLYAGGSLRARGLLLTLTYYSRPRLLSNGITVKDTFFCLQDIKTEDARNFRTLRKLIEELERKGMVLVIRRRPYYVVRILG